MSIELIVAVALGLGLTKLVVSCFTKETPRQAHRRAMLESYQALREGRVIDRNRSEFTANRMLAQK